MLDTKYLMSSGTAAWAKPIFCSVLLWKYHIDFAKFTYRGLVLLVFSQVLQVTNDLIFCFKGSIFTVIVAWVHGNNRERGISVITNYLFFPLRFAARTAFLSVSGILPKLACASSKVICDSLIRSIRNIALQMEQLYDLPLYSSKSQGPAPQKTQNVILGPAHVRVGNRLSLLQSSHFYNIGIG